MKYLFAPISLLAIILLLNLKKDFYSIEESCEARDICYGYCTLGNYPDLTCVDKKINITYNGNAYQHFFFYPNPNQNAVDLLDARHVDSGNEVLEDEVLTINTDLHWAEADTDKSGDISKDEFEQNVRKHNLDIFPNNKFNQEAYDIFWAKFDKPVFVKRPDGMLYDETPPDGKLNKAEFKEWVRGWSIATDTDEVS